LSSIVDRISQGTSYVAAGGCGCYIAPISAPHLAAQGYAEVPGTSAALAALRAAQTAASAQRRGRDPAGAVADERTRLATEAIEELRTSQAAQDALDARLSAHFAAAVREAGEAREGVGTGLVTRDAATEMAPVRLCLAEDRERLEGDEQVVWVGRWPPTVRAIVGGAAFGLQEESARVLASFRRGV